MPSRGARSGEEVGASASLSLSSVRYEIHGHSLVRKLKTLNSSVSPGTELVGRLRFSLLPSRQQIILARGSDNRALGGI